jgi:hypothetical protein
MAALTPAEMVTMYIKLRDTKKLKDDEHKKSLARIIEGMTKLEGLLLAHLQAAGTDSAACAAGTVYKRIETSVSVEDPVAFDAWVMDQTDNSVLDIKPNKTAIKGMLERNEPIPPGVKITQIALVGVQRK